LMYITIGVDVEEGVDAPMLHLLKRLRFNAAKVEAVRVVSREYYPLGDPGMGAYATSVEQMFEIEEKNAENVSQQVAAVFGSASAGATVLQGHPVHMLLGHAQEKSADLIAIDGRETNPLLAAMIGSTSRGLLLGASQSVLIAKDAKDPKKSDVPEDRPVRAVLATDHSPYANKCWEHLMRFMPRGIEHITILTAYPKNYFEAWEPLLPPMGVSAASAIYNDLHNRNEELKTRLAQRFDPAVTTIDAVVSPLSVHEAIQQQMAESQADLLILGAKGHGLLERLTIGSVALREALTQPKSVLVVRQ
jgi:nucleotide-binding universal stress UspA family protein